MKKIAFPIILIISIVCICLLYLKYDTDNTKNKILANTYDLEQIISKDTLSVVTLYSSTTYFIYRGKEMGFQYELCEQFAESLGVNLKIIVAQNVDEMLEILEDKKADLMAYFLPHTKIYKNKVLFCGDEVITHQVLVQRKVRREEDLITDVVQLIGKDIYVMPGKYLERLNNLNEELGGGIHIHTVANDSISTEKLIAQVAKKEIDYTIADNDIAKLNKTYFTNLSINLPVSFDQKASWATRKECAALAKAINEWYASNKRSPLYTASVKRYFEKRKSIPHTPILSLKEGIISPYDSLFKAYAPSINWDWRLLASLAYTESNFNPDIISWAGAVGLMQLMPTTAYSMGMPEGKENDPEESVKAATKYIALMDRYLKRIDDKNERTKFVLGAYNAGLGHIYDAMALTEKYGLNQYLWEDNVEKYILLKSREEYYNDPVCKNGYFRGTETYNFVRDIMKRFEIYQTKIK